MRFALTPGSLPASPPAATTRMNAAPLAVVAVLALAAPASANAQYGVGGAPGGPRVVVGGGALAAQPVGEFKNYVNSGFGGGGHLLLRADRRGVLSMRVDAGYLVYGHEKERVTLQEVGRVQFDVTTTNNILTYSAGPQLMMPTGPVRPYAHAFVGGAYFFTQSSISGRDEDYAFASSRNLSDNVPSYGYGGGVFIPFAVRNALVGLDLGARFIRNGHTRYLREGGITDLPDGGSVISPIESQTSLIVYQVGVSAGLRSGRRR
jgi:hypothetical protein